MTSLRVALTSRPARYLRSRWPWRSLAWCLQAAAAGWVLAGLLAVAIAPAASGAWDLSGPSPWWIAEIVAIGSALAGFVLVGAWQRRAVTILGFAPIASLAAWIVPEARRRGDLVRGFLRDLLAGIVFLPVATLATLIAWLGWVAPLVGVSGLLALVVPGGTNPISVPPMPSLATGLAVGGLAVTAALPWLWGWTALAGVWLLRRCHDRRGDAARRQSAQRQAASLRLTDLFSSERRRIERDLHDGAQQRIVALGFTLGRLEAELARQDARGELAQARELARQAASENGQVLGDLRALVRSVRPQVLTDLGLAAALEEVAARAGTPTSVRVEVTERPDELVEETAYFAVLEALTNADRHARAEQIWVRVQRREDRVEVEVVDSGQGGAQVRDGGGLAGLIDRVGALGGHLDVTSPPGGPTRVQVSLPVQVPYQRLRGSGLSEAAP